MCSGARVQPSVDDADDILETVGSTDRYESLTAADSTWPTQGLESGERELGLGKRHPALPAQASVPTRRGSFKAPRLLLERQQ
jgi:hypothetical protein